MTLNEIYEKKRRENPALEMLKGVMDVTGKSSVTVRMWLKGLSTPCLAEQKAISEYLGVPCEELFKS